MHLIVLSLQDILQTVCSEFQGVTYFSFNNLLYLQATKHTQLLRIPHIKHLQIFVNDNNSLIQSYGVTPFPSHKLHSWTCQMNTVELAKLTRLHFCMQQNFWITLQNYTYLW